MSGNKKFKFDLHVHSKYSGDTDSEPEEAVIFAIESGLDGIAFTEHYSYDASEHAEWLRDKYRDQIIILRGVEFSAAEGHCLVFGMNTDKLLSRDAPLQDVIQIAAEYRSIVIPSHPFRGNNSVGEHIRYIKGLHALEGHNGYSHYAQNIKAVNLANELSLSYMGGSDAHEPREVGACYTEFDDPVTQVNFLDLLRAGQYTGIDTRKISRAWNF
jgi:predicted metal-dependent phosphoesterase TrpH